MFLCLLSWKQCTRTSDIEHEKLKLRESEERERARACEHKNGSEKKSVGKERGNFIACSFTRCRSHRSFSPSKRFNSANPRCMDNGGVKSLYYMNMACTLWQNANRRVWVLNEFSLPPPQPNPTLSAIQTVSHSIALGIVHIRTQPHHETWFLNRPYLAFHITQKRTI